MFSYSKRGGKTVNAAPSLSTTFVDSVDGSSYLFRPNMGLCPLRRVGEAKGLVRGVDYLQI